jgi:CubicO group peptidase (beta-lactamase class C family)
VAKQITATAVLQLVEQHRLKLSDTLGKFVPELGSPGAALTIDHLLTHTSGLRDYNSLLNFRVVKTLDMAMVRDSLRGRPTQFPPGTKYEYSNSNYAVLAMVVERVAGTSLRDYAARSIFGPLGMANSEVVDERHVVVGAHAVAYARHANTYQLSDFGVLELDNGNRFYFPSSIHGGGGIFASPDDLERWCNGLFNGRVLSHASIANAWRVHTQAPSLTGIDKIEGYGYGWVISRRGEHAVIWHDGSLVGHRAMLAIVPDLKISIVFLSAGSVDPIAITSQVLDYLDIKNAVDRQQR